MLSALPAILALFATPASVSAVEESSMVVLRDGLECGLACFDGPTSEPAVCEGRRNDDLSCLCSVQLPLYSECISRCPIAEVSQLEVVLNEVCAGRPGFPVSLPGTAVGADIAVPAEPSAAATGPIPTSILMAASLAPAEPVPSVPPVMDMMGGRRPNSRLWSSISLSAHPEDGRMGGRMSALAKQRGRQGLAQLRADRKQAGWPQDGPGPAWAHDSDDSWGGGVLESMNMEFFVIWLVVAIGAFLVASFPEGE